MLVLKAKSREGRSNAAAITITVIVLERGEKNMRVKLFRASFR